MGFAHEWTSTLEVVTNQVALRFLLTCHSEGEFLIIPRLQRAFSVPYHVKEPFCARCIFAPFGRNSQFCPAEWESGFLEGRSLGLAQGLSDGQGGSFCRSLHSLVPLLPHPNWGTVTMGVCPYGGPQTPPPPPRPTSL